MYLQHVASCKILTLLAWVSQRSGKSVQRNVENELIHTCSKHQEVVRVCDVYTYRLFLTIYLAKIISKKPNSIINHHVSLIQSSLLSTLCLFHHHLFSLFWGCEWKQKLSATQAIHQFKWWFLNLILNKWYSVDLSHVPLCFLYFCQTVTCLQLRFLAFTGSICGCIAAVLKGIKEIDKWEKTKYYSYIFF